MCVAIIPNQFHQKSNLLIGPAEKSNKLCRPTSNGMRLQSHANDWCENGTDYFDNRLGILLCTCSMRMCELLERVGRTIGLNTNNLLDGILQLLLISNSINACELMLSSRYLLCVVRVEFCRFFGLHDSPLVGNSGTITIKSVLLNLPRNRFMIHRGIILWFT